MQRRILKSPAEAMQCLARYQSDGGICAYIDALGDFDCDLASALGCHMDDLYLAQPQTLLDKLRILNSLISSQQLTAIVVRGDEVEIYEQAI